MSMTFTLTQGFGCCKDEDTEKKKDNETHKFKLFDDDDNLYFHGFSYLPEGFSEDAFEPLDYAMIMYGCTRIDYKNDKTGEYETL